MLTKVTSNSRYGALIPPVTNHPVIYSKGPGGPLFFCGTSRGRSTRTSQEVCKTSWRSWPTTSEVHQDLLEVLANHQLVAPLSISQRGLTGPPRLSPVGPPGGPAPVHRASPRNRLASSHRSNTSVIKSIHKLRGARDKTININILRTKPAKLLTGDASRATTG